MAAVAATEAGAAVAVVSTSVCTTVYPEMAVMVTAAVQVVMVTVVAAMVAAETAAVLAFESEASVLWHCIKTCFFINMNQLFS